MANKKVELPNTGTTEIHIKVLNKEASEIIIEGDPIDLIRAIVDAYMQHDDFHFILRTAMMYILSEVENKGE